jgi:hypothetical protein
VDVRRDGDDVGGGGEALPFAEPPVRGRVHEGAQLPARLQNRGIPMGRLQVARHGTQVLLQEALLILDHPAERCYDLDGTVVSIPFNLPLYGVVAVVACSISRVRVPVMYRVRTY